MEVHMIKNIAFLVIIVLGLTEVAIAQETMQTELGWIQTASNLLDMIAQLCFGLMIVATIVARILPGKDNEKKLFAVLGKFEKVIGYLPTFGVNPRTKELRLAYEEAKRQNEELKAKVEPPK
jgi:hypothetical protein